MTTEAKFLAAVDVINSIPYDGTFEPSEEIMLKFYAYEMQATEGPCNSPKPYVWSISARNKWLYWKSLEGMPKVTAMEQYIEELTKVIETMAYNDKISKFMSLMGSFYEHVSSDENESQKEKKMQVDNWTEIQNCHTDSEDFCHPSILELYNFDKNTEPIPKQSLLQSKEITTHPPHCFPSPRKNFPLYSHSTSSSSSDISNFDLLSDLSDVVDSAESSENDAKSSEPCNSRKTLLFSSKKDLLVLTIINLQSDLENVVKKLDNLNGLARTANVECDDVANSKLKHDKWSLNFTGTAFAFLWPLAVELCFGPLE